ncbi:MAG: selenium-dependent molybdenum cofactor biosynthesis protein YqeB [Candidatus Caldatribacteriota bacterium]|nr:selenium-dependent molybdenum cofactor biosynthesis protein YqeB [Candidatus Caldatribacteriota bacterium]
MNKILAVIRGGGDLATGVAVRLFRAGFKIIILEIEKPTVIRLPVSFARSVYENKVEIEDIEAVLVSSGEEAEDITNQRKIAVLIDPKGYYINKLHPTVLVDAILAKRNLGTRKGQAPLVLGLGPGFTVGKDVDVVVETKRGHYLGRVIYKGKAESDSGIPGEIKGESVRRLLRAPAEGNIISLHKIGDLVKSGEVIAKIAGVPLKAEISGALRGLIYPKIWVSEGMKVGDIDPRGIRDYCFTVSDKARSIGGAVLEAICTYLSKINYWKVNQRRKLK